MDAHISDLLRIIREEIGLYRDLIEHARRKTPLLVRGSVEAILESNKIDDTYNIKLRMLEDELLRLCRALCRERSIPMPEFTLLKLAEGLEESLCAEIRSLVMLFKNLLDQLKQINQRNIRLVESSMSVSKGLLDIIADATSSYRGNGMFMPYSGAQSTITRKV